MADYYSPTPHMLDTSCYPTHTQHHTFLTTYLKHHALHAKASAPTFTDLCKSIFNLALVSFK